jgi:YVTN family beta-propeller protein
VDVVDLRNQSTEPRYSFNLPVGGIHGAGACGNRVFFAPKNGVCWVDCDFDFAETSETVSIEHLSLDEDPSGTDYRTGAFETFENHMLCIANSKAGAPTLCVINGTAPTPVVTRIPCVDLEEGLKLSTVRATKIVGNKSFAFAFAEGEELEEKLLVFELDPNGDHSFDDAKLVNSIKVGPSKLEGHFGHHGITFLGNNKTAVVTNPGDGTLSVIDLVKQEVSQTIDVGGQPTHLVCYGETM